MREIVFTHVPMTTLPVALLRPVNECEDAVSFQLHFSLLFHFLCIFTFSGFPMSTQAGSECSSSEWHGVILSQPPPVTAVIIKQGRLGNELTIFGNSHSQLDEVQCPFVHNCTLNRNRRDKNRG